MSNTLDDIDTGHIIKCVIVGDSGVGKTSMMLRYTDNIFYEFTPKIHIDFKIKAKEIDNLTHKMFIWDTAGQERFRTITSSLYRGSHIVIITYDITDKKSFENVRSWINHVEHHCSSSIIIIVGNKIDLINKKVISYEEGNELAMEYNFNFFEVSAKTNENIDNLFNLAMDLGIDKINNRKKHSNIICHKSIDKKTNKCICN